MGGSSSAATSSKTYQSENNSTLADYSQGNGDRSNVSVSGEGNQISILDGGAIRDSLQFADKQNERAQTAVAVSVAATQALAARQSQNDADTVDKIIALTDTITTGGAMTTTKYLIGMFVFFALAGAAVAILGGKKGKA